MIIITVPEIQFLREKKFKQTIAPVKLGDDEEITFETATTALKRAVNFLTALQSDHGHWPAEIAGTQYFLPPLVILLTKISLHCITFEFFEAHRLIM